MKHSIIQEPLNGTLRDLLDDFYQLPGAAS